MTERAANEVGSGRRSAGSAGALQQSNSPVRTWKHGQRGGGDVDVRGVVNGLQEHFDFLWRVVQRDYRFALVHLRRLWGPCCGLGQACHAAEERADCDERGEVHLEGGRFADEDDVAVGVPDGGGGRERGRGRGRGHCRSGLGEGRRSRSASAGALAAYKHWRWWQRQRRGHRR